jgi:threonine dehydratase
MSPGNEDTCRRGTGKRIGVLLSGGNMDLDQYATLLAQ